ncbi:MAG: hypothetical protein QM755_03300 [Luteolibacter sp.]
MKSSSIRAGVVAAWRGAFREPPSFRTDDWLDGDTLEFLLGKDFEEILPLIDTPLEHTPVLSLLPLEAACYYAGSHLLDALETWERFLRKEWCLVWHVVSYWALLSHVKVPENREWYRRTPECERMVGEVFAFITGPLREAFPEEMSEEDLDELREIAREYGAS